MKDANHRKSARRAAFRLAALAALMLGLAGAAEAQLGGISDDPTAHNTLPVPAQAETQDTFGRVLESICWYLPNRVMDIADIFRFHLSAGDGEGVTVRCTKYLEASWFEDDAFCFGWAGKAQNHRIPPFFGEQVEERYFGFFAAQAGEVRRDPTEVGFSVHLLIVGANFAISLGEALDAITGIVGVDLYGDDHGPVMYDYTKENQPPPAAAPAPAPAKAPAAASAQSALVPGNAKIVQTAASDPRAASAASAPSAVPAPAQSGAHRLITVSALARSSSAGATSSGLAASK